jgi:hypothetical protein
VASTQEIIGQLQSGKQKITDTIQVLSAAENAAAQMQQQMGAMGVQGKAAEFGQVRESIKKSSSTSTVARSSLTRPPTRPGRPARAAVEERRAVLRCRLR